MSADPGHPEIRPEIETTGQISGWSGARNSWTGAPAGPSPALPTAPVRRTRRQEVLLLIGLLLVGVLVAVVWRLLAPHTAKLGDDDEASAAVDGTLALLGLVVGALTAVVVLCWPGPAPATRTVTAIVGSLLGGVVSWRVGDLIGTPHLRAVGAAFFWPVATSAVLFVGALLPGTSARLQLPDQPPPVPEPFS